ncbi:Tyrosine-protein kinase ptk [Pedobacter sp. Bi27]|uniref:GumC family protein n=1 Tax=unclassified Pedobacter TaxID=2628915 RepID=UPI001D7356C5|nr:MULTISPECIES: tyrosine-protein kinase [unclassified Pedobacter]CAH0198580.1 Tyrosine-protein kinase ptk [Pedobacter sp. Bi36]CAH0254147.1 Tyrosine-protein kinase ptk [Pedobacter sp. Bi126]CAH0308294.1 Tyrosine-protein kinase ptk [Pedobacter sp. Bi27]
MNTYSEKKNLQNLEGDSIDIKQIFLKIKDKWSWFFISVIFCLFISFLYIRYTPPIYQINARVLVNDDEKGGGIGKQAGALMDLGGILGGKNSVDNEAEILKTRSLMDQVVRQMKLNIVYTKKGSLTNREVYESPFKINLIQEVDTISFTKLKIDLEKNNKISISGKDIDLEVNWGQIFEIKGIGKLSISKEDLVGPNKGIYYVSISSIDERVATLMKQLSVGVYNKQVTIIDLGFSYPVPKKGEDILNALIKQYTQSNLNDKNVIADSTTKFIQKRLSLIASELGDVENKVQSFKTNNKLADMSEQGRLLVQSSGEITSELAKAETQVSILNDLEKYLKDTGKNQRVFPTSLLPQDMVFSGLMNQYNTLLIERDKQLLSVTEESPFIKNLDTQISEMRKGILSNIQSTKNTFVVTRDKLMSQLNQSEGKISNVPQIEKDYLKLARNQQIKQELYIFLMQKAEETAISKTSNISIAKTIDPPKAAVLPVSPKKNIVYLIGLFIGLIVPITVVFVVDIMNTGIGTKDDVTNRTSVPVIGEISHNESDDNLIVANKGRSAISEQFRALRTNLSFYLKNENDKVILLTSSMSGEGKSFTAINLGNILALAGKKVLLMELDLRKPGLSVKLGVSNDIGFSNFTIDSSLKPANIVKQLTINKNMYIVSSGPLPPNPAETIMSEYTPGLIAELKKEFDYIIMDAPPIGIIADAQLLAKYADVTLYLVRQKFTKKDQLNIVEELYSSGKMKNMGIVVNDISSKYYGYGYGYGNYGQSENQKWYSSIFKRMK